MYVYIYIIFQMHTHTNEIRISRVRAQHFSPMRAEDKPARRTGGIISRGTTWRNTPRLVTIGKAR